MSRSLDIDLVRTFAAAADAGSMVAAANARNLTQGAVSQQIARLEDMLGSTLFFRSRKGLRLTTEGERFLLKARRLLGLNDEIWSMMSADQVGDRLRLGVPHDLAAAIFDPIIKTHSQDHPQVTLSLLSASSPELLSALDEGSIDLAIVEEPAIEPLREENLRVEQLVWIGATSGDAHRRRPLPVSLVSESCVFKTAVLSSLEEQGTAWQALYQSGNIEATKAAVRADLAVTAWLASTVPPGFSILGSADGLPKLPHFSISLYRARGDTSRAATAMADLIRSTFGRRRTA